MSLTKFPQWVAIYTAPRSEKTVADRIAQDLHLQVYLPMKQVRRKWSDRIKLVKVPLIPSYAFVKMCERDIFYVNNVQGMVGYVSFPSTGIAVIPDEEIEAMRQLCESMEAVQVANTQQLKLGAKVRVADGEFKGMKGTIIQDHSDSNFSVQISGLNISLIVNIQPLALEPIDQ